MAEKELNPEEQKLRVRRRLLKMAVYSIPAISTILTSKDAYSDGEKSLTDEYYDKFNAEDEVDPAEGSRAGTGIKTKRKTPNGRKKYKKGLS